MPKKLSEFIVFAGNSLKLFSISGDKFKVSNQDGKMLFNANADLVNKDTPYSSTWSKANAEWLTNHK